MPGGFYHQCCAERACAVSGITPVRMEAFRLGAQGPDPLFLIGMFPLSLKSRPSKLAGFMHKRRTGRFLCALAREAKTAGDAERAYAMGYLTHYAVDGAIHPYVYSQSYDGRGRYSSVRHMSMERGWDTEMWRAAGKRGTPESMPCVKEAQADWPRAAALIAAAAKEAYPELDVAPEAVERGFADACRANRLTHSPHGVRYALYWLVERLLLHPGLVTAQCCPVRPAREDTMNREGRAWRSAAEPERERHESVEELTAQGVRRAAQLMQAAKDYFDGALDEAAFASIVGNAGMDTGAESLE